MRKTIEYFDCVECQDQHFENEPKFKEHIMRQSKHGIKEISVSNCSNCNKDMGPIPVSEFCSKTCHLEWQKSQNVIDLNKIRMMNKIMGKTK